MLRDGTTRSGSEPAQTSIATHVTKPDAEYLKHVTADHLRDWYRAKDVLPDGLETLIDADSTPDDTIQQTLRESGLDQVLPIDR